MRAHAIDFLGASLQEADLKMTLKNEVYLVYLRCLLHQGHVYSELVVLLPFGDSPAPLPAGEEAAAQAKVRPSYTRERI